MQLKRSFMPALMAGLAMLQAATAFDVTVSSYSCEQMLITLDLTSAEFQTAASLSVLNGATQVSEVGLDGSFTPTVLSADFRVIFFDGETPVTGPARLTFVLLDANDEQLTTTAAIQRDLEFQCGTTVSSTSSAAPPSSTRGTGNTNGNSNNNGGNSGGGSSSSGGGSNIGAIVGGVVGGIGGLALIGLLAFCLMRRKREQLRQGLGHHDIDEGASRGPNDSTVSLATAPEHADHAGTPMMRDIGTSNVFADPSSGGHGGKAAEGAGVGAVAAIAARKGSREQSRSRSPSVKNQRLPYPSAQDMDEMPHIPSNAHSVPPPAAPAAVAAPSPAAIEKPSPAAPAVNEPATNMSNLSPASSAPEAAAITPDASSSPETSKAALIGVGAAAAAAAAAAAGKSKSSKWGFKRNSQVDAANKTKTPSRTPADSQSLASSTTPSQKSAEGASSPARSFKVIQKAQSPPIPTSPEFGGVPPAGPYPSSSRSGHGTPSGSTRQFNYSRAPSVASLSAGFGEAPAMPPSNAAPSVASAPAGEFGGGNMAGIGAGRSLGTTSANSTKWHQQHYSVMPNFTSRPFARSTQLEEDLIFGNLGMGLASPPPPAGGGSETGSGRSRKDPFGDHQ